MKEINIAGLVVLDIEKPHQNIEKKAICKIKLGGVGFNLATAISELGGRINFWTVRYKGEFPIDLSSDPKFETSDIFYIGQHTFPPLYEVELDADGAVHQDAFWENQSLESLSAAILKDQIRLKPGSMLIVPSDLPLETLNHLGRRCKLNNVDYWIINANITEIEKLSAVDKELCFGLSLNIEELSVLAGQSLDSIESICRSAFSLIKNNGLMLVTLGKGGSLVCYKHRDRMECFHQKVTHLRLESTIGAGDYLTGALLYYYYTDHPLKKALNFGTKYALKKLINKSAAFKPASWNEATIPMPEKITLDF